MSVQTARRSLTTRERAGHRHRGVSDPSLRPRGGTGDKSGGSLTPLSFAAGSERPVADGTMRRPLHDSRLLQVVGVVAHVADSSIADSVPADAEQRLRVSLSLAN
jgi:hypothetical protein